MTQTPHIRILNFSYYSITRTKNSVLESVQCHYVPLRYSHNDWETPPTSLFTTPEPDSKDYGKTNQSITEFSTNL